MPATLNGFGFVPTRHSGGGIVRTSVYDIAIPSAYGTAILKGMPVILNTSGNIVAGTAAADIIGIFAGVEFFDATGLPRFLPNWPASQALGTGTVSRAYVYDDPDLIYRVQADGAVVQTGIGDQADVSSVGAGSTANGLSAATLSATLAGAGVQAQFRITGLFAAVDNAWSDAFPILEVMIARHEYRSNKLAI